MDDLVGYNVDVLLGWAFLGNRTVMKVRGFKKFCLFVSVLKKNQGMKL
jgi:hypothetical protein